MVLVPQDYLGHDFQRYSVAVGIGCRVSPEIMRRNGDTKFGPELPYKSSGGGSSTADYPNAPSWHGDILIFIVSHAAETMGLDILNLFEISHAAEHASRPLIREV